MTTEVLRKGCGIYTTRLIEEMAKGKPGDTKTREEMAQIAGLDEVHPLTESGRKGYQAVRSAIRHCEGSGIGIIWSWDRASQKYKCLTPADTASVVGSDKKSIHHRSGRALRRAETVNLNDLNPADRLKFNLDTLQVGMARASTGNAMKKRLEVLANDKKLSQPTPEEMSRIFDKPKSM